MGIHIREGVPREFGGDPGANFFCSVDGWAFGPTFRDYEDADEFLSWATHRKGVEDLRKLDRVDLGELHLEWLALKGEPGQTSRRVLSRIYDGR